MSQQKITISSLLADLENGVTRLKGGKGYNEELGSIEEKYGITKVHVNEIFTHPKLKNKKTKTPLPFILVDDLEQISIVLESAPNFEEETNITTVETTPEATAEETTKTPVPFVI